jgi:hypothetical protein
MSKITANSKPTAKPRGKPFPKGVSGNPKGAPKRGESWGEIIKRIGDMTPVEAADYANEIAKQLRKIGSGITLKEAVVVRVYAALLFEPQASLLNSFMERAEGKVVQPIKGSVNMTWSDFVKTDEEASTE